MEFIIDTVNLEDIKEAVEYMPIVGVTSNPSIVKKTSPKDFFQHMKEVRKIIGKERSLHIQVISKECDEIVKEAHRIIEEIDDQVYIKVPVSYEGVKAIKKLKTEGLDELNDKGNELLSEVDNITEVKDELVNAAEDYNNYSGINDNEMNGKVRFVLKVQDSSEESNKEDNTKETTNDNTQEKQGLWDWIKSLFGK